MFVLPSLPFSYTAVSGWLSRETLDTHFKKHHQGYLDKLNSLLPGSGFERSTLREMIEKGEGDLFNNAAQVWNHSFYWLGIGNGRQPDPLKSFSDLQALIERSFGSLEALRTQLLASIQGVFGSGWVWLVMDESSDRMKIVTTKDADNPLRQGLKPLLVCDVWEHAYYIDFRNNRKLYAEGFVDWINWAFVDRNLRQTEPCAITKLLADPEEGFRERIKSPELQAAV